MPNVDTSRAVTNTLHVFTLSEGRLHTVALCIQSLESEADRQATSTPSTDGIAHIPYKDVFSSKHGLCLGIQRLHALHAIVAGCSERLYLLM